MITLDNETVSLLKTLYNQIDGESGKSVSDYNLDLVIENQYKILDILKYRLFPKIPVITLTVPLYAEDDAGNIVPFTPEEVEVALNEIRGETIAGYACNIEGCATIEYGGTI